MESLGRELTAAEREEMQRRQDLKLAQEMFGKSFNTFSTILTLLGTDGESSEAASYNDILTKEEFEEWGTKVCNIILLISSIIYRLVHSWPLDTKLLIMETLLTN